MARRKEATDLMNTICDRVMGSIYPTKAEVLSDLTLLEMELLYDWGGPPQEEGFFWYRDKKFQPEIVAKVYFDIATSSWVAAFAGGSSFINVSELSGQWARVPSC